MVDSAKLQIEMPELAPDPRSEDEPVATSVRYVEVPLHDENLPKEGKSSERSPSSCPESSPPACRVCLEDTTNGALVAPCSCIGSLQWAHPACIQTWINEKGNKLCEICRQPYRGPYKDPPNKAAPIFPGALAAQMRGVTLMPQGLLQLSVAQRIEEDNSDTEQNGAHSSAAWCLSAVLLFMSLLLLRQAFEPLSRQSDAAVPASSVGGVNRHIAAPSSILHGSSNATSSILLLPSGSAMGPNRTDQEQEDDSTSLFWVTVRLLMFLLPFLMLLRVVTTMREIRLNRNSTGHAADHSFAAILWNMEAGMRDDQFARTPLNLHPAAQHASTPLLHF